MKDRINYANKLSNEPPIENIWKLVTWRSKKCKIYTIKNTKIQRTWQTKCRKTITINIEKW